MHVVVLAYGPAQTSKQAVRRARSLLGPDGQLIAVAASPTGRDAIAKLGPANRAEAIGRIGLIEALARLNDAPILLIHDDVVITTQSVAALRRELDTGTRLVVPYSNDPDTGYLDGPLPVGAAAEKQLDQLPAPQHSAVPQRIRSTCILAQKADLESLLHDSLADPFSTVNAEFRDCRVAAGALAAHSTQCLRQTCDDDPSGRPLLVAALIVKNEEAMLAGCLESLEGLVDRIEVCDTGSTDNTIAIARAAGANVIERDWPDSFAVARNYVLDRCRDAVYIFSIDADERAECSNPADLRRYLATYSEEHRALSIEMANIEPDGTETMRFRSIKIFRADDVEYRGSVHEAIYPIGEAEPLDGAEFSQIWIAHYGYAAKIVADKDKVQRNLELAEAEYRDNPGPRSAVHLARTLAHAGGSAHRALALLEETRDGIPDATPAARAQVLNLMADQCVVLGDDKRAFDLSREAMALVPADDTAAAQLAQTAARLGRLQDLIPIAEDAASRVSVRPAQEVAANRAIFRSALVAAYVEAEQPEQAVAEAFDALSEYPESFGAWGPLIEILVTNYGPAAIEIITPLAVKDPNGMFLDPVVRVLGSAGCADFCVAYYAAGGNLAEPAKVGLMAAVISNDDRAFSTLAEQASLLDDDVRIGLIERISEHGRPDLAGRLQPISLNA